MEEKALALSIALMLVALLFPSFFSHFAPNFSRYSFDFHHIPFFNTKYLRISNKTTTFAQ